VTPVKAAVLGSPIAHSLSPVLHTAGYAALGLQGWTYSAIECGEAGLPALIGSCGPDWAGLSLTMPLKRAVLPLLDTIEPLAADVGGANTVVFDQGRRHGYNTDVAGMVATLADAGVTAPPSAVVLGAGATAASALAALRDTGLRTVTVAVRDPARAAGLLDVARRLAVHVDLQPLATVGDGVPAPDLLISTVPAGAADFLGDKLEAGHPVPPCVFDVVYAPWPTRLARAAQQSGATVVGGFELLLHQAVGQFELMTGHHPAPLEAMRTAGVAELTRRSAAV
jgi:shikimate dehydrogenase